MAYEISGVGAVKATFVSAGDLSALQFTFVKMATGGLIAAVAAATDIPVGVLQNAPTAGQEAEVLLAGVTKLVAGGALDTDVLVGTTSAGRAVVNTAGTSTTLYVAGRLLTAAGANGDIVTAAIDCIAPGRGA